MPVDFPTALARLLRDGALRDRFAIDPASVVGTLDVTPDDASALLAFSAKDLEYQAITLLRKRFDACRGFFPVTRAGLEAEAFPLFAQYARLCWPADPNREILDAQAFLDYLARSRPQAISSTDKRCLSFLQGSCRLSVFWGPVLLARGKRRTALHILLRGRDGRARAWTIRLGL